MTVSTLIPRVLATTGTKGSSRVWAGDQSNIETDPDPAGQERERAGVHHAGRTRGASTQGIHHAGKCLDADSEFLALPICWYQTLCVFSFLYKLDGATMK